MGVIPNMLNWALALMKLCLPGGQHITQRDGERLNDSVHEPTKKITLTSMVISAMLRVGEFIHPCKELYLFIFPSM